LAGAEPKNADSLADKQVHAEDKVHAEDQAQAEERVQADLFAGN
jgi:hypothetical protein